MYQIGNHKVAQPVIFYEQKLPEKLVDLLYEEIQNMKEEDFTESTIGNSISKEVNSDIRNSKVSWWYEDHWACSVLSHYFNKSNREYWEYDLNHLDRIQITTYGPGDHYTWHCDYGTSDDERYTRKISASVLISDPSEYQGGDLTFIDYHGKRIAAPKQKGTMIIFDSRTPHSVSTVTEGKRISLVAWMLGPKLR
jgi:PKHD-type hydroxylase